MSNMRLNAITNSQFNVQKNVNAFGHPMKKQVAEAVNPMSTLNMKRELKKQIMNAGSSNNRSVNSVLDNSTSYLDSLREARNKEKNAVLEKKRLKYSYKSISSKIINCKKSYSAREAVSLAKREIARLKKLRGKEDYDMEELEAAIAHAQAMERVAKKKVRHLEEEEMAKASGGACIEGFEEKEDNALEDEEFNIEDLDEDMSMDENYMYAADAEFDEDMSMEEIEDLMREMSKDMTDIMDDMGLDELFDDLGVVESKDMDPADLKMMKIKHRYKEMKEIAKADSDYLKVIFEKLERERAAIAGSIKMNAPAMNMQSQVVTAIPMPDVSETTIQMPSIDISV